MCFLTHKAVGWECPVYCFFFYGIWFLKRIGIVSVQYLCVLFIIFIIGSDVLYCIYFLNKSNV